MLPNQREDYAREIPLKGKPRNDLFMKRFVGRNQGIDGDFKPGALRTLAGVIKTGQLVSFGRDPRAGLKDRAHQRQARLSRSDPSLGITRRPQLSLQVLSSKSQPFILTPARSRSIPHCALQGKCKHPASWKSLTSRWHRYICRV